jgi:DNA polymerase V
MQVHAAETGAKIVLPLYATSVQAGFPSPAEDYVEGKLDLNDLLIRRPAATFYVRATGDSMIGAGILPNDLLVVDRSLPATHGAIIIAMLNGELTIKRLYNRGGETRLMSENPAYEPIEISGDIELWYWGVVTAAIHQFNGPTPKGRRR